MLSSMIVPYSGDLHRGSTSAEGAAAAAEAFDEVLLETFCRILLRFYDSYRLRMHTNCSCTQLIQHRKMLKLLKLSFH
jgi:hypothetical protein